MKPQPSKHLHVAADPNAVDVYLDCLQQTLCAISREDIWAVIHVLFDAWQHGRQIFTCGNGGSAATASHMANDLNKFTIVPGKPRMRVIALTDNVPLITAWGNDQSYADVFAEQLLNFIQPKDVVIGISCSGHSLNVLSALRVARQYEAVTIGLTGNDGGQLKTLVDHCVHIPDDHIGRQEDGHMILDHVIASTLRQLILATPAS